MRSVCTFILLLFFLQVPAQKVLVLPDTGAVISLSGYMQVVTDSSGKLELRDVTAPSFNKAWEKAQTKYSYDFTPVSFWTKTQLRTEQSGEYTLYLDYSGLGHVEFYLFGDSLLSRQTGGLEISRAHHRDVFNKIPFTFHADAGSGYTVFILVKGGEGMSSFPAYAGGERAVQERSYAESMGRAVFYGISFIMFLSFLLSFGFTRDWNYLLYSLVALLHLLNRLSFSGELDALWGDHPHWRYYADSITQLVSMTCVVYFMIRFLGTRAHFKWLHYALVLCMAVTALTVPFVFFNPGIGITVGNTMGPFIMIFSISAAILRIRRHRYKPAVYFLFGWGGFYLGVICLLLCYSGVVPSYLAYGFEAGIVIEMIFFSMAVAENYQLIRREQQEAQTALIGQLKENERIIDAANRGLEQKVKERTQELSQKNKEVLDSIEYAKRIQQAKLPKKEEVTGLLPQSFVLFKPKDIVSGDFYFVHKRNNLVFIAAADCTGHGVPGALMSMIGSEKLVEAVEQHDDPALVLAQLNKGIRQSLRQSDSDDSTRDGMDIAFCTIDIDRKTVRYAGANRPLWIVRKDTETLEEIKATKKALGGLTTNEQEFEPHEVALQAGDTFYIFSDGYADTFSGKDSKKLTTKRFKELLLRIREKPMEEQGLFLDDFIEQWKGETGQVDDMLVIGVRL